jgi:hypothetical protein
MSIEKESGELENNIILYPSSTRALGEEIDKFPQAETYFFPIMVPPLQKNYFREVPDRVSHLSSYECLKSSILNLNSEIVGNDLKVCYQYLVRKLYLFTYFMLFTCDNYEYTEI